MPVRKVQGGYRWGQSGKVYPTEAQAERQGRAAYASGYKGYQDGGIVDVTQGDDPSMVDRVGNFMDVAGNGENYSFWDRILDMPLGPGSRTTLRDAPGYFKGALPVIAETARYIPTGAGDVAEAGHFLSSLRSPEYREELITAPPMTTPYGSLEEAREELGPETYSLLSQHGQLPTVSQFNQPQWEGIAALLPAIPGMTTLQKAGIRRTREARAARDMELLGDVVPNRLRITPDTNLPEEMTVIQRRFAEQLNSDIDTALADYARLPDTDGGRIISTDIARELSADYRGNRALSAVVHEPASALMKERYARMLSEEAPDHLDNSVLFTAGGTGSGKTTALQNVPEVFEKQVRAQVVYDTNLASFESSKKKIDQALAADKQVVIAYVHRDPTEALTGGAIPRAIKQEIEIGTGRTVPATAHARTHANSANTIKRLQVHYGDNPNVDVRIIDNTRGRGNAVEAKLESGDPDMSIIDDFDYNELLEEVLDEVEKVYAEGGISSEIYRGFVEGSERG